MTYGDQIWLVGFDSIINETGELAVTLVWQALRLPDNNYQVFVHLLDESGQIVARSDVAPGDGYATGQWLAGEVVVNARYADASGVGRSIDNAVACPDYTNRSPAND